MEKPLPRVGDGPEEWVVRGDRNVGRGRTRRDVGAHAPLVQFPLQTDGGGEVFVETGVERYR